MSSMIGFGTSESAHQLGERTVVGVGEMSVFKDCSMTLSSFALGSCVGVVVFDPINRLGALLNVMLPESKISEEKARQQPYVFADSGLLALREKVLSMGTQECDIKVALAGGASAMTSNDTFKLGQKNSDAVKMMIHQFGWNIVATELGGLTNRSLHLEIGSGKLIIGQIQDKREVLMS